MSAIVGAFGRDPGVEREADILRRLAERGTTHHQVWRSPGAFLAVARHDWEVDSAFSGQSLVVDDGSVLVVADASLYYRDELRRQLASSGVHLPHDYSPSDAVLAAYAVAGDDAPGVLEGDFAFILWDRRRRRLLAARDFGGKRPLYYTLGDDGGIAVASTIDALIAHRGNPPALNVAVLAETLAQCWSGSNETCYQGVYELPAGSTLVWAGGSPKLARHWTPPEIGAATGIDFEEGANELRALLSRATEERMSSGVTAVWMSGGWDSSAVFASGQAAKRERGVAGSLHPVSMSYPIGDPGREDELIATVAAHWNVEVTWLQVDDIPLLDRPAERAELRDQPFAHTYEHWNGALAAASRSIGARVALDGNGGDQLFQVSDVFLADLFAAGRWIALAEEWRAKGGRGLGTFFDWAIAPALPSFGRRRLLRAMGRRAADDLERSLPPWLRSDFIRRHQIVTRDRASLPRRRGYRGWRRESHFFLAAPVFPRAFQCLAGIALDQGVELRSPLYDRRVVEFACGRPREERNAGPESKRLVRAAMRGLLPESFLAPRRTRTGITTAYSDRKMREEFPPLLERYLRDPILAQLGIIEPTQVAAAWSAYCRTGDLALKIPLFLTLQVELWLRARLGSKSGNLAFAPTGALSPPCHN